MAYDAIGPAKQRSPDLIIAHGEKRILQKQSCFQKHSFPTKTSSMGLWIYGTLQGLDGTQDTPVLRDGEVNRITDMTGVGRRSVTTKLGREMHKMKIIVTTFSASSNSLPPRELNCCANCEWENSGRATLNTILTQEGFLFQNSLQDPLTSWFMELCPFKQVRPWGDQMIGHRVASLLLSIGWN